MTLHARATTTCWLHGDSGDVESDFFSLAAMVALVAMVAIVAVLLCQHCVATVLMCWLRCDGADVLVALRRC
jgi:hypothetical protein